MRRNLLGLAAASVVALTAFDGHAQDPEKYTIGAILAMSGSGDWYGKVMSAGIQLAVDEINKSKQYAIKTVLEDDKSEVTDAANAAQKVINVDKVNILIGSVPSSNTNAMAPIA